MEHNADGSVLLTAEEQRELNSAYQAMYRYLARMPSYMGDFFTQKMHVAIVKWEHQLRGEVFDYEEYFDEKEPDEEEEEEEDDDECEDCEEEEEDDDLDGYEEIILDTRPFTSYPLNEISGNIVHDVSGNGHDATLMIEKETSS